MLDTRTLVIASVMVSALLGLIALLYSWRDPRARAIRLWSVAALLLSAGYLLIALRGSVADILSVAAGNTLVVGAVALSWSALRRFRAAAGRDWLGASATALTFVVLTVNVFYLPVTAPRVVWVSAIVMLLFARNALELRRNAPPECRSSYGFTEAVCWVTAAIVAVRGGVIAMQPADADTLAAAPVNALPFLFLTGVIAAATLGVFWIEVQYLQRELVHSSRHDSLTGLLNRPAFLDAVARELSRVERGAGTLSVAMLDLDHFKLVNDRYGHQVGDRVLRTFADILQASIRKHDIAGRYGGEEFTLLMPDTDREMALRVLERVRAEFESHPAEVGGARIPVTVSAGASTFGIDGRSWDALLSAADRALYRSKDAGRNRISVAA